LKNKKVGLKKRGAGKWAGGDTFGKHVQRGEKWL